MTMRWYVVNAQPNCEESVARSIRETAERRGLADRFEEVIVPTEESIEVRGGKKVPVKRKHFPGYVLVRMELSEETWNLVNRLPKVLGFLQNAGKPVPMSQRDADRLLNRLREDQERPTPTKIVYEVGDRVRVTDGPFTSFTGSVEEIDHKTGRLKVSVSIFGRATPVDLEVTQIDRAA